MSNIYKRYNTNAKTSWPPTPLDSSPNPSWPPPLDRSPKTIMATPLWQVIYLPVRWNFGHVTNLTWGLPARGRCLQPYKRWQRPPRGQLSSLYVCEYIWPIEIKPLNYLRSLVTTINIQSQRHSTLKNIQSLKNKVPSVFYCLLNLELLEPIRWLLNLQLQHSWYNIPKREKIYQIATKNKCPKNTKWI
jgi:hypothetical protein